MEKINLETISAEYKDNIYAIAFNYFKNGTDADDIVQEVLLKYYKETKEFESKEHIRNWLIRVTLNQCKKVSFSSWFTKHTPLADYVEALSYEEKEESDLFLAVMDLPTKYRIVTHLYYYEGYSTREISKLLKIKETTVSTRLMRARKILREKLQEVWKDE